MALNRPLDVTITDDLVGRFESRIFPEPNSGCWLWDGCLDGSGYGMFSVKSKSKAAHRMSWLIYRGEDPAERCILHRCDNRCCVNPDHLRIGTQKDNIQDAVLKGRWSRPKPYGEENAAAKLDAQKVLWLRDVIGSGQMTAKDAAKHLGICDATARLAARGDCWGHIAPHTYVVRKRSTETHCVNGHPFNEKNTYRDPYRPGRRACRTCTNEAARRSRARKAELRAKHVPALQAEISRCGGPQA